MTNERIEGIKRRSKLNYCNIGLSGWMAKEDVRYLLEEVDRLQKIVDMKERYIERLGFCPDCRDKVDGSCYRCRVQTLERMCENLNKGINSNETMVP